EEGPPSVGAGAPPGTLREALRLPGRFWALTALWLVYGVTGGTVNTFGAAFLAETGLDPLRADRVITWSMLGVVPATPLLGWWVDRHGGLHGLLTVCGLLAGLVLGLLVCRCTEPEPLGVLYGAVLAGIPLAVFLLLPRWVGPARVGLGFALVQGAMSIGALLGPVLAGVLRDRTGTHGWGMRLGVVLVTLTGVIGAGLWIRCGREGRSPPRGPGIARPLDGS
ncbi:MAG: MFS transporter, partial [Deltaproteobacteria bacterium]|nr:MFS transporter [Deltaproteobacteria bacterium]